MERVQGVKVGEFWNDRLDCRQWGAHFPHVAGIAGQSNQGAQSVVLSGGCVPLLLSLPEGSSCMPEASEACLLHCWWRVPHAAVVTQNSCAARKPTSPQASCAA